MNILNRLSLAVLLTWGSAGLLLSTAGATRPALAAVPAPAAGNAGARVPIAATAADTVRVTLVATTDLHGNLLAEDYATGRPAARGLARLATWMRRIRRENERTLYIDAGDLLQGTPLADLAARSGSSSSRPGGATSPLRPTVMADILAGALSCQAITVGNHDFDFGVPLLRASARAAHDQGCEFLSANCVDASGKPAFEPYRVVDVGGVRVGILGLTTTATPSWEPRENMGGLTFTDPVEAARKWVEVLRNKEHADVVVVVAHMGLESDVPGHTAVTGQLEGENRGYALATAGLHLDALVLGHTHVFLPGQRIENTLVVQPGKWGERLARVDFRLTPAAGGGWHVAGANYRSYAAADSVPADSQVAALARPYEEAAQHELDRSLATTADTIVAAHPYLQPDPFTDLIAATELEATHADAALASLFNPEMRIPPGYVTLRQASAMYPFENTLVAVRCTAATLKAALEQSARFFREYHFDSADSGLTRADIQGYNYDIAGGVDYRVNLLRPPGSRVTGLSLHGRLLQPGDSLTVALNSFRASGAGGYTMLAGLPVVYRSQATVRDLLIEKLKRIGGWTPSRGPRHWAVLPEYLSDSQREVFDRMARTGAAVVTPIGNLILPGGRAAKGGNYAALLKAAAARFRELDLLEVTDFHGGILGGGRDRVTQKPLGGSPILAGYIDRERARNPGRTLLLDDGDSFQGSAISNLTFGRSVMRLMNLEGTDVMSVGNHDFDWGVDTLVARIHQARFPVLSANIFVRKTGLRPAWAKPYALLHRNGLTVGVIGLITQSTPSVTLPVNVAPFEFRDPDQVANALVPELRAKGAQIVVVLDHEGGEVDRDGKPSGAILDVARGLKGVDVVLGGHSHNFICTRVENGIPVVVAASNGRALGKVRVIYDVAQRRVVETYPSIQTVFTDGAAPDTAVAALVSRLDAAVGPLMARVLGHADVELSRGGPEPRMGNLVADVTRTAVGAQIGFQNSGGVRTDIPAGLITMGQVYELMPFDNTIVTAHMTGAEVKGVLEEWMGHGRPIVSGLKVTVNRSRPAGSRVVSLALEDGTPLDTSATYTVATNDFLAAGGDGLTCFKKARDLTNTGRVIRDAIRDWVLAEDKAGRAIHPPAGSRITELR